MSALGLTCREAFTVFSQNETLRLQNDVLRLETELAHLKARFIKKQIQLGFVGEGCYEGQCAWCERWHDDCRCDWVCDCKWCVEGRQDLKTRGWTDDEIRTIRRRPTPKGCIQVCDVCGAAHDEECLCDWTCECRVCDEWRDILRHEGWTDRQLIDYNRYDRLDPPKPNVYNPHP